VPRTPRATVRSAMICSHDGHGRGTVSSETVCTRQYRLIIAATEIRLYRYGCRSRSWWTPGRELLTATARNVVAIAPIVPPSLVLLVLLIKALQYYIFLRYLDAICA
jgi:hypothetical protein